MNRNLKYLLISFTLVWLVNTSGSSEIRDQQIIYPVNIFNSKLSNERIYIHTDREIYIAGENLFFKVYLYDEGQKELSVRSKMVYLFISDLNNNRILQLCVPVSGGIGYGSLSLPDTLKTGPYDIIACTNWMRNFGESTFFHKQVLIANRFDDELLSVSPAVKNEDEIIQKDNKAICLMIPSDRESYHQREKVTLKMYLPANSHANVSISVAEKPPEKFGNTTLAETLSTRDMSTSQNLNGSRGYRKMCEYLVEDKGFIISGSVNNTASCEGILVMLSTPDTIANLLYSTTNTSGKFYFQLEEYYYNKELYISIPDRYKELQSELILDDKYAFGYKFTLTNALISDLTKQYIRKSQTIANINRTYKIQSADSEMEPVTRRLKGNVYYEPDYKILLTDFVPFKNFTEIVRETLPCIRLRKNAGSYDVEIVDSENKIFLENPAIFINGLFINDINYIVSFGSDKIQRIETVTHKRVFGSLEFNGILSVFTSADVKNDIFFSHNILHFMPIILQSRTQYTFPEYSTRKKIVSRNPDFRQLLYWNPSVDIEGSQPISVEFYTSDNKGSYVINIEGITSDGNPISCVEYFDVR
jgi:hypothetical protein